MPLSETEPRNSGVRVKMKTLFSSPEGAVAKRTLSSSLSLPLSEPKILDDFRIKKTIPTIQYLIGQGARVILMSHLGRPDGKVVESLRLTPIQNKLMEYLDLSITKTSDCVGPEIEKWTLEMKPGEVLLLENLRFYKEELENDDKFARDLARLGDVYVNDAFATCHRNQASVVSLPKYLPHTMGLSLEKEIEFLTKIIRNPKRPLVAIIGGAKIEKTKLKLINKFSKDGEWILIGGLVKKGIEDKGIKLDYPQKVIGPTEKIIGEDISKETIDIFKEKIEEAKTIFWDGVVGKTEEKRFQTGSEEIARAIIQSKAFSVVGGGETVAFINRLGLADKFNHVSTGGGAMIAFLAGEELPGIEALK